MLIVDVLGTGMCAGIIRKSDRPLVTAVYQSR